MVVLHAASAVIDGVDKAMSGPPIPPRRKRAPGSSKTHDYSEDDYTQSAYQYDAYDAPAATAVSACGHVYVACLSVIAR